MTDEGRGRDALTIGPDVIQVTRSQVGSSTGPCLLPDKRVLL